MPIEYSHEKHRVGNLMADSITEAFLLGGLLRGDLYAPGYNPAVIESLGRAVRLFNALLSDDFGLSNDNQGPPVAHGG